MMKDTRNRFEIASARAQLVDALSGKIEMSFGNEETGKFYSEADLNRIKKRAQVAALDWVLRDVCGGYDLSNWLTEIGFQGRKVVEKYRAKGRWVEPHDSRNTS